MNKNKISYTYQVSIVKTTDEKIAPFQELQTYLNAIVWKVKIYKNFWGKEKRTTSQTWFYKKSISQDQEILRQLKLCDDLQQVETLLQENGLSKSDFEYTMTYS